MICSPGSILPDVRFIAKRTEKYMVLNSNAQFNTEPACHGAVIAPRIKQRPCSLLYVSRDVYGFVPCIWTSVHICESVGRFLSLCVCVYTCVCCVCVCACSCEGV